MSTIVFQGERGAFSELAARQYFGKESRYEARPEFSDVYDAVASGEFDYGILPIENSMAGSIHQNYDLLLKGKLFIVGEIYLKISHYFMTNDKIAPEKITRIYSHPQGFAQCKKFLKDYKHAELIAVSNTAAAVKKIKDEGLQDAAAIGSMQAAEDYGMTVLFDHIEDNHNNQTRFIILSKKQEKIEGRSHRIKTTIVFSTKNIPGVLFKTLSVFALRDIDLHKIESRPFPGRHFEYMFYLDFEGHSDDESQRNALNHLREITTFEQVLGSYYVGKIAEPELRSVAVDG